MNKMTYIQEVGSSLGCDPLLPQMPDILYAVLLTDHDADEAFQAGAGEALRMCAVA